MAIHYACCEHCAPSSQYHPRVPDTHTTPCDMCPAENQPILW